MLLFLALLLLSLLMMMTHAAWAAAAKKNNPPWPPTYNMLESLITMQCNHSGWSSPQRGAQFGIVSYDWSNAKDAWARDKPMSCEEYLLKQAIMTKQRQVSTHVFVYRNIVKALPWFKTVREKLQDPAYAGFFLKFDSSQNSYHVPPCAAENQTKCSDFYHDQEQTPAVPSANNNPHPDGSCDGYCDCGDAIPCGEYVFDHRNGSMLRQFIVNEVILGPTAVGHDAVDGLFLDDYWCSDLLCQEHKLKGCPCHDPVQGPTEMDPHSQVDMGLSNEDIRDLTLAWNETMQAVQQALLQHHAYTWSLIPGQENANAIPLLLKPETCAHLLRKACSDDSHWQRQPVLFGFTNLNHTLSQLEQDLAFFLLARGPYSYAGWGVWGMTWPFNPEPAHGELPPQPHGVPLPREFFVDYGRPLHGGGVCEQVAAGIFVREWTRSKVQLDCNVFQAKIELREEEEDGTSLSSETSLPLIDA